MQKNQACGRRGLFYYYVCPPGGEPRFGLLINVSSFPFPFSEHLEEEERALIQQDGEEAVPADGGLTSLLSDFMIFTALPHLTNACVSRTTAPTSAASCTLPERNWL